MNAYGMQSGGSGMPPVPQNIFATYSSSSATSTGKLLAQQRLASLLYPGEQSLSKFGWADRVKEYLAQRMPVLLHHKRATASPNQQAAATPPAAAEPRLTALNPVPTVGSAVSAVAKMFGAIDIAAARHPNSHSPAQEKSRKRKCSGRAK